MEQALDSEIRQANQSYIRSAMRHPLLSREEERELAFAWRFMGNEEALHQLVEAYGRLVVAMAARFRHYGIPLSDLIQEGNVGLLQAAMRFDPLRGIRFSTYAGWWVRSMLQDYILRNWSIVRTGVTTAHKTLFFNLRRLRSKIAASTGDSELTLDGRRKIAEILRVSLRDVEQMEQRLSANDQSLNAPVSTEETSAKWQDLLVDERPTPEDVFALRHDQRVRSQCVSRAMETLNDRERVIILARKLRERGVTLEQMGKTLGVSKERVRQLEMRALSKLKTALVNMPDIRSEWVA